MVRRPAAAEAGVLADDYALLQARITEAERARDGHDVRHVAVRKGSGSACMTVFAIASTSKTKTSNTII
jgi:hypothetical protein